MYIFSQDRSDLYDLSKYAVIHMENGYISLSRAEDDDGGMIIAQYATDNMALRVMKCISRALSDGVKVFVTPKEDWIDDQL